MGYRYRASHPKNSVELQRAVKDGSLPEVRHLVSSYGLANSPDRTGGYSLLCSALRYGHADIARYLIKSGSAVNGQDHEYQTRRETTPLHHAVSRGFSDIVKMLLDRYADANAGNPSGQTPLHLAVIADFPKGDRNDVIQCLLDRGASVNALNLHGMTPLHEACNRNSVAVVTRLVARGASIHSEVSPVMPRFQLYSPLHFAVSSGSVEIAGYLVQRGSHVVIEDKASPLHLAVQKADISMIQTLMRAQLEYLPLLLNLSILSGRRDILEYLLENGAEINPTESLHPLHFAAAAGKSALCDFLLKNGAYIDAKQTLSKDQVHEQTRLLCNSELDLKSLSLDGLGKTALHFATENNRLDVVELLLRHGADVDSTDEEGQTALHVACRMKPASQLTVLKLLDYGTDVNIEDQYGQTVFHVSPTYNLQSKRNLFRHFVKLIAAGFYVDKRLQALIPSASAEFFTKLCEKEIAELRSEKIAVGINFYKIFNKTLNEMAVLTKNEGVAEVFKSGEFRIRFPMYSGMLKARFVRGESRAKLLDEVPITFYENLVFRLPYLCVKKILDYLSDGDLKRLNDACKQPPFRGIL